MYEEMKNREGTSSCCVCFTTSDKCWRHCLRDIKIDDSGDAMNNWTHYWFHWLKYEQMGIPHNMTTFRLYWKYSDISFNNNNMKLSAWLKI